jgi:hypothetical protein
MAVAEEAFANMRADEARTAGDEKIHCENYFCCCATPILATPR